MSTQTPPGVICPKSTLPIDQAARLATVCRRLKEELEAAAGLAADLSIDHRDIRELRGVLRDLDKAFTLAKGAHRTAEGLWDAACEAERNQGGQR
ncbi:hypothetical protein [Methylococcus sp. EFPC2]|uniref:hypothetical protein n=1 Tax=Methylococcus sp. EFPC2 TaxID=2812648 RepID=UPI0019677563|nr:hypothetical protein [Methylococcus sp. EFPC2]QSA98723.1 hypothetical protein JWZ97_08050 [Methylococcus sp. EFPC2]